MNACVIEDIMYFNEATMRVSLLLVLLILSFSEAKKKTPIEPDDIVKPIPIKTNVMCRDTPQCLSTLGDLFCQPELLCIEGYCHRIPDTPCISQTQTCDEASKQCIAKRCIVSNDCDDGVFCNGIERCINQTCQPSKRGSRCPANLCNETTRQCSETRRLAHWRNAQENEDFISSTNSTPVVIGDAEGRLGLNYVLAGIVVMILFTLCFLLIALMRRNWMPVPVEGASYMYS